jgi:hypothetical protein
MTSDRNFDLGLVLPDPSVIVPQLLSAAGLAPPREDVAALVESYPGTRAAVDALYAVPGLTDTVSILSFFVATSDPA